MYNLIDANGESHGLFSDLRVAYANMIWSPYALWLINNVTGEVLYNNLDK